jgi:DNA repair protein RadC
LFDTKHRLIKTTIVSVGELDASVASPREIFRDALLTSAFGVALFHNHPSGDPSPSADDLLVTAKLKAAGDMLGVRVMDHIILGRDGYFSFMEAGRL